NAWIASRVLQEFWQTHKGPIVWACLGATTVSAAVWLGLEASFRRRILIRISGQNAANDFSSGLFISSGILRLLTLGAAAIVLIPSALAGAPALAILLFLALAFFLTIVDIVVRNDAAA